MNVWRAQTDECEEERCGRYLSHFLKVFVPFLEGSRSVQGLPHACVLAEKGLTVVLDPVQHLWAKVRNNREDTEWRTAATRRRRAAKYWGPFG